MKLNIINILNEIANEESTLQLLNDPCAFWNIDATIELHNAYKYYKAGIEMQNEYTWDMIEWLDKNGQDYSHWKISKIMTYNEWLSKELEMRSKYMVAA